MDDMPTSFNPYQRGIQDGCCFLRTANTTLHCREYQMFEELSLECLISDNFPVYPDRVREFYWSFTYDRHSKAIHFQLDGLVYNWDLTTFNTVLGFPHGGWQFYTPTFDPTDWSVDSRRLNRIDLRMDEVMLAVVQPPFVDMCRAGQGIMFCHLKSHVKDLYKVIRSNITCRGTESEFDGVLAIEAIMMFWLLNGINFDVGFIIANRMWDAGCTVMDPLPFGMLLTKLFRFLGLNNDGLMSYNVPRREIMY